MCKILPNDEKKLVFTSSQNLQSFGTSQRSGLTDKKEPLARPF